MKYKARKGGYGLLVATLGTMLGAAVVYALSLVDYIFPGESAHLMTQWSGMTSLQLPLHPMWGKLMNCAVHATTPASMAVRVNLISFFSIVFSAGLVCYLTAWFVREVIHQEDTIKMEQPTSIVAGIVAGLAFITASCVWRSATHLEYRSFELFFALVTSVVWTLPAHNKKLFWPSIILAGFLMGLGLVEGVLFIAILPLSIWLTIVTSVKSGKKFYLALVVFGIALFSTVFFAFNHYADSFLTTKIAADAGYHNATNVFTAIARVYMRDMRGWFSRPGWLYIQLFTVMPFISCAFASVRALNNERKMSEYLLHIGMTICTVLALATPLAPETLVRRWGIEPLGVTTAAAMVAGYVAAYWFLLWCTPIPERKSKKWNSTIQLGTNIAPAIGGIFLVILTLGALLNIWTLQLKRGAVADICANEILDRMGDKTWFVTDGLLDDHLRVVASTRNQELNLICLQNDMDDSYLKELADLIKSKKLNEVTRARLEMSVQLGVLPFLQDWFANDENVAKKVAIFGVPDLWYMGDRQPVPNSIFFNGAKIGEKIDVLALMKDFEAMWKKLGPLLCSKDPKGSHDILNESDPVEVLRLQLRRHIGFIGNNLGVLLQDNQHNKEAWKIYELVLNEIDRDNICTLCNEFEMVRIGSEFAKGRKAEIEKKFKEILDTPTRRYAFWSLSRYYGYIRTPEVFARMGFTWARSGQTGNAIAQVRRAIEFVPTERQAGLLNMMAAIYASGNEKAKSREMYEKVLKSDKDNHDALLGMTRLALAEGAVSKAKEYLTKAVESNKSGNQAVNSFDWTLLHLMNNDLAAARMSMQKVTDMQPRSMQAWAMLSGVLLQQYDEAKNEKEKTKILEELEKIILPRMTKVAESPRDYFLQMTRALVLLRKGEKFRKEAREALTIAAMVRPDVSLVGDMLLNLDIEMDDPDSALKHARMVMRRDRHNKLANYVIGSINLKDGDYQNAEAYLTISVKQEHPLGAALNDLAETLRRLQRFAEAETYARKATEVQPNLYVCWETLGATLLDQNKDLDKAEEYVNKAIKLAKEMSNIEDLRMNITLARVQLAKNDMNRARGTLRSLRTRQKELSNYERSELERLFKAAKMP